MAARDLSREPVADLTRLANRAAVLAFAAAFALVAALIAIPHGLRGGDPARLVVASAALVVAFVVTGSAWRARAQLRAARMRAESAPESAESKAAQVHAVPHGGEAPTATAPPRRSGVGGRSTSRPGMGPHRT